MRRLLVCILLLLIGTTVGAYPYLSVSSHDYESDFPRVTLRVHAALPPRTPTILDDDSLAVYENGFRVTAAVRQAPDVLPVYAVLAMDTSRSIDPRRFERSVSQLKRVASRSTDARLALARFNDEAVLLASFPAQDNRAGDVLDAAAGLKQHGTETMLYNCLYDAVDLLSGSRGSGRAVLVWTDGHDEGSGVTAEDVASFARDKNVSIVFITDRKARGIKAARRIAKISGGEVIAPDSEHATDSLAAYLSRRGTDYEVKYQSAAKPGEPVELEIRLKSGSYRDRTVLAVTPGQHGFSIIPALPAISRSTVRSVLIVLAIIVGAAAFTLLLIYLTRQMRAADRRKRETVRLYDDEPVALSSSAIPYREPVRAESAVAEEEIAAEPAVVVQDDEEIQEEEEPVELTDIRAWFFVKEGNDKGEKFTIRPGECIVGKAKGCDVRVRDQNASDQHARIRFTGTEFVLYDLATEWGTYLNGRKLLRPKKLYDWDEIQLGSTVLIFRMNIPAE